jgi:predicted  nucleic acid-binding Zn-ribbon protein
MPGPAAIFREIHRLRRHVKDLQIRIDQGPRQLRAHQSNVTAKEEEFLLAQEAIKKLKVKMHEDEVSLKATQQQLAKYLKQMNEATVKKEYDALRTEIDNARREIPRLEDAILDAMGQIEERSAQLPVYEKAVQTAKASRADFESELEARLADLSDQLRQALEQITAVEATLPEATREHYDRLVRLKGEEALSALEGQSCVACYTAITAQNHHDLRQEMFVVCKNCGRILYLPA